MKNKIEKPWVVYKGENYMPIDVGLISKEEQNGSLYILYTEGQFYSPECWNPEYVSRFENSVEAVKYFIKIRGGNLEKELERLSNKFPKAISAQRSPKYKEESKRHERYPGDGDPVMEAMFNAFGNNEFY
jgi:hypothetical protein